MMRRILYFVLVTAALSGVSTQQLSAQAQALEFSAAAAQALQVSITPSPTAHYLGEPILLRLLFENTATDAHYRFRLWEHPYEQWTFTVNSRQDMFSMEGDWAAGTERPNEQHFATFAYREWEYARAAGAAVPAFTREVTLAAGETFSVLVRLDEYVEFTHPGFYEVSGSFYPLSRAQEQYQLSVAPLRIEVQAGFAARAEVQGETQPDFLTQPPPVPVVGTAPKPPQQAETGAGAGAVVKTLLRTLTLKRWEAYLSHFQLTALITNSYRSTAYYERLVTATAAERRVILSEFMEFLVSSTDYDILSAELLRVTEVGQEAEVAVLLATHEFYQRLRESLNPLTGQLERNWSELQTTQPLKRQRIFTYRLAKVVDVWKVIAVDVELFDGTLASLRRRYGFTATGQTAAAHEFLQRLLFDFNSAELKPEQLSLLQELAEFMILQPAVQVRLLGFTDDLGTELYNQNLSIARVRVVRDIIIAGGVHVGRIEALARGESNPLNFNQTEAERRLNRRVEIYFTR